MSLPVASPIEAQLAAWCDGFRNAMGESLQSIVLFGGLAKGEFVPQHSDVNLLILFHSIDAGVLDRAAPWMRQGAFEFGLAPMLLTEADLRDSADVFPIKFLDMQRRHKVLWGGDPFAKVTVTRENLRLRCEQELRNLLLRLRQSYIQRSDRPELLQAALSRAVSSLLVNVGVLLELQTGHVPGTKQDALAKAGVLGIPLEPVRQAWAVKQGQVQLDAGAIRQLFGAFMDAVHKAAQLTGRPS